MGSLLAIPKMAEKVMIFSLRSLLGGLLLSVSTLTVAADMPMARTGAPVKKTLIVETVYPYTVFEYNPPLDLPMLRSDENADLTHPEKLLKAYFSYLRSGNYEGYISLWTESSKRLMEDADKRANRTKETWRALWAGAFQSRNVQVTHWVTYGRYVLLQYRVVTANPSPSDEATAVLVKMGSEWRLTQELKADPVVANWRAAPSRIQIPADAVLPPATR